MSGNDERERTKERNSEAKRRQTQFLIMPCHTGAAAPQPQTSLRKSAQTDLLRRTTVGVPPRLLPRGLSSPKAQRQARLPETRQERAVLYARPNRGAKTLRS